MEKKFAPYKLSGCNIFIIILLFADQNVHRKKGGHKKQKQPEIHLGNFENLRNEPVVAS